MKRTSLEGCSFAAEPLAGNPGDKEHQNRETAEPVRFLREHFPDTPIIGLWIDVAWTCHEIEI